MADVDNAGRSGISTRSGAQPVEAGLGIVHANTLLATTDDELAARPPTASFELWVGDRKCSDRVAELGLGPGKYEALTRLSMSHGAAIEKKTRLHLIDPSRICRRFGARYGSLEYDLPVVTGPGKTQPWETLWKTGPVQDIVVDFEQPYKFVLWRGMSFAPSWALGNVMTCNFFAETVEPGVFRDCCEMMSDRECRYIHARVIHNSPARVVIHWRHPLSDSDYTICRDQWVDEIYYIYPDGVAVRNVTIHLDPADETAWETCPRTGRRVPCNMMGAPPGKRTFNNMEFITVNPPGATSDDVTPLDAFTMLDAHEFLQTYTWPEPPDLGGESQPELSEYIFRMNYRHRPGVFIASHAPGLQVRLMRKTSAIRYEAGARVQDDRWVHVPTIPSNFYDCVHWPITRGYGTTPLADLAEYHDRPTHTFLGHADNAPVEVRENGAVTWRWLSGIAPEDNAQLRAQVGAWASPPEVKGARYDGGQRAYVVEASGNYVELTISSPQPPASATFVLVGHHAKALRVEIDGRPVDRSDLAIGTERTIDSVQTVVTFQRMPPACRTIAFCDLQPK